MSSLKKRAVCLILGTVILFSFAGCKNDSPTDSSTSQTFTTTESTVEEAVKPVSYGIKEAYNFSNGTAWIKYGSTLALIDTKGNQLFQTTIPSSYRIYEMDENTSCVSVSTKAVPENEYTIVNKKDGAVIKTYTSDDFDGVIGSGGGYVFFRKRKTTIDSSETRLYAIDSSGETVKEHAVDFDFADYIGNGILSAEGVYYNDNDSEKHCQAVIYNVSNDTLIKTPDLSKNYCENNYYQLFDDGCYTLTEQGQLKNLGLSDYAEIDKNILYRYDSKTKTLYVHNLDSGKEYTFSKYPVRHVRTLDDGKTLVELVGAGENSFITVLDSSGNILFEPLRGKRENSDDLQININSNAYLVSNARDVFNGDNKALVRAYYTSNGFGEVALIDLTTGERDPNFNSSKRYREVDQFHDGLARVKVAEEEYYYIDPSGNIVIS